MIFFLNRIIKGQILEGKEAMSKAGIKVPGLEARDGLSVINGSNF